MIIFIMISMFVIVSVGIRLVVWCRRKKQHQMDEIQLSIDDEMIHAERDKSGGTGFTTPQNFEQIEHL